MTVAPTRDEAEAVAFVVSGAIGLDVNTASSDYIQLHAGDKATLAESLAFVQQTAAEILKAIMPEGGPLKRIAPCFQLRDAHGVR